MNLRKLYMLFPLWVGAFFVVACNDNNNNESIGIQGIGITVPKPINISVEELVSDFKVIKLEATENSLFGDILQIFGMNDKLYVIDRYLTSVFIYSDQGKYLGKIDNRGNGPAEYVNIGSFETDRVNNRLLLTDSFSKRLFIYDDMGNLQETIPLGFSPYMIASDKSKRFIHVNSSSEKTYANNDMRKYNVHIVDEKGKVTDCFLKDDTPNRIDIRTAQSFALSDDEELLFMPKLSDKVYVIKGEKAEVYCTLNNQTDLKSVKESDKEKIFYTYDKQNLEEYEKDGFLISCGGFQVNDSFFFFKFGWNTPIYTYYHKEFKQSISVYPDKLDGNKGLSMIFSRCPKLAFDDCFYIDIPLAIKDYVMSLIPNGILKEELSEITDDDNPCIIRYQINEDLFLK